MQLQETKEWSYSYIGYQYTCNSRLRSAVIDIRNIKMYSQNIIG